MALKMFTKATCIVMMLFLDLFQMRAQETLFIDGTVEFVVNTDEVVKNGNYYRFINETLPFLRKNAKDVESVILIGSASPEGRYNHNVYLADIRAEKIYSFMRGFIPRTKLIIDNDYRLFLRKTGLDDSDYTKLRATYIEVKLTKEKQVPTVVTDTVYIEKRDTIYKDVVKEVYKPVNCCETGKPVFAVYNDLLGDLLFRANIGAEVYFNKLSFFVEGSFSNWNLVGKTYNIDVWHIGLRKYFNNQYNKLFIEINANAGYFDTDLFGSGKIGILYGGGVGCGYVFSLGRHWKISPVFRLGLFEKIYYADYNPADGNINVSFGNYIDGKTNNTNSTTPTNNAYVEVVNKSITSDFIKKSNKAYYIGPTYVGVVLKRDFCIKRNKKKKD